MLPNNNKAFIESLAFQKPPLEWPDALRSIWFDAKGDWESSHNIAQDMHNSMGSWLHAYLHRKEGDRFNAGYWYRQAGRTYPEISLNEEQKVIVEFILEDKAHS